MTTRTEPTVYATVESLTLALRNTSRKYKLETTGWNDTLRYKLRPEGTSGYYCSGRTDLHLSRELGERLAATWGRDKYGFHFRGYRGVERILADLGGKQAVVALKAERRRMEEEAEARRRERETEQLAAKARDLLAQTERAHNLDPISTTLLQQTLQNVLAQLAK